MFRTLVNRLRRRAPSGAEEAQSPDVRRLERDLDQARADDHARRRPTGDLPPGAGGGDGWV
jgi:hypothetical protein